MQPNHSAIDLSKTHVQVVKFNGVSVTSPVGEEFRAADFGLEVFPVGAEFEISLVPIDDGAVSEGSGHAE